MSLQKPASQRMAGGSRSNSSAGSAASFSTRSSKRGGATTMDHLSHLADNHKAAAKGPTGNLGFVNWPCRHLAKGEYFNKSVLFALSTRPHHLGRDRLLATDQRPSDQELTCVEYKKKDEMTSDFQLKLDQCVLVEVNPDGPAFAAGVTEGYQLVFVDGKRVKHMDVFEALEKLEKFPCKLGFVSPLAEPPNLSDRQVAQRLGMNYVKQKMLHKATELMEDIAEKEGDSFKLTFKKFRTVMQNAGILWLEKKELRDLFDGLDRDDSGSVDLDEWNLGVADKLIFDDKFSKLIKGVNRHHIRDASYFLEMTLKKKKSRMVTFAEFASGLFKGGITWLTRQQLQWMFEFVDEDNSKLISFPEWAARFQFDIIEAAHEVQRYLENYKNGNKKKNPIPDEMDLDLFILTLHDSGVTWLAEEQITQLFIMIDRDKSGIITPQELKQIGDLVDQYYEVRASMRKSMTFNTTISSRKSMQGSAGELQTEEGKEPLGWSQEPGPPTKQAIDGDLFVDKALTGHDVDPSKPTPRTAYAFDEVAQDILADVVPPIETADESVHSVDSIENRMSGDISRDIMAVTVEQKVQQVASSACSAEEVVDEDEIPKDGQHVWEGKSATESDFYSSNFEMTGEQAGLLALTRSPDKRSSFAPIGENNLDFDAKQSESASAAEELTNALLSNSITGHVREETGAGLFGLLEQDLKPLHFPSTHDQRAAGGTEVNVGIASATSSIADKDSEGGNKRHRYNAEVIVSGSEVSSEGADPKSGPDDEDEEHSRLLEAISGTLGSPRGAAAKTEPLALMESSRTDERQPGGNNALSSSVSSSSDGANRGQQLLGLQPPVADASRRNSDIDPPESYIFNEVPSSSAVSSVVGEGDALDSLLVGFGEKKTSAVPAAEELHTDENEDEMNSHTAFQNIDASASSSKEIATIEEAQHQNLQPTPREAEPGFLSSSSDEHHGFHHDPEAEENKKHDPFSILSSEEEQHENVQEDEHPDIHTEIDSSQHSATLDLRQGTEILPAGAVPTPAQEPPPETTVAATNSNIAEAIPLVADDTSLDAATQRTTKETTNNESNAVDPPTEQEAVDIPGTERALEQSAAAINKGKAAEPEPASSAVPPAIQHEVSKEPPVSSSSSDRGRNAERKNANKNSDFAEDELSEEDILDSGHANHSDNESDPWR
ncbi:unnamed protein product [Amoebophrya sp. A120]|nr:unnamed protein product [Amoebophrya sp. A120]|eukprot:GSA120T00005304001.1